MKYLVLGSGVLGVTTAYLLASRGHEVEVIDRQPESADETSFANGGQLSFSHAEPWANPSVLPKILPWMFKKDAPLVFRPRADMAMIRWGLAFLRNCTPARSRINTERMLRLGLYSKLKTDALCQETGIIFDNVQKGILHIFTQQKEFDHAVKQSQFQETLGGKETVLSSAEAIALEPTLAHATNKIIGGIHAPIDESGDPKLFCDALTRLCREKLGVEFYFNVSIERIKTEAGRITAVQTSAGEYKADGYIMAMGSYSYLAMKAIGVHIPVYPMKGYSITLPTNAFSPITSITDTEHKIVFSRLGSRLRVAGTAEFAGYDTTIHAHRIAPIAKATHNLFPRIDTNPLHTWACLRPSTPDGSPIIGKCAYANLYLNTGHGTLGWTQACASAHLLADIIESRPTEISMEGLTLDRYQ